MATAFFPSSISTQIRLNGIHSLFMSSTFLPPATPILSTSTSNRRPRDMVVRMGGGPRTFPGGVSKWEWKRMQQKKAKQLLKARLLRERQVYEMRKRAELKSALSQLERPWEAVQKAPKLFSVGADEQVKTLADRFQKPGGFDMWNEKDGPRIFKRPNEELPSVRFFPKGAVHSIKPYTKEGEEVSAQEQGEALRFDDWIAKGAGHIRKTRSWREKKSVDMERAQGVSQNVLKENYNTNQRRNSSYGRNMIDAEVTKDAQDNKSKNVSTKADKAGNMYKRNAVRNQHSFRSFGEKRGGTQRTQGARQNVSQNEMRWKPVEQDGDGKSERNGRYATTGNRRHSFRSFGEKRGGTERTQGACQNVSQIEMRRKSEEKDGEVKAESNGRYTTNGSRKFQTVTTTFRPSSFLSNKERRIEK
ncbi:copper ion transmembrane transporter [Carex rostrata]